MNFCLIWQLSFNSAYNSFFCFPFFLCQINAPSPPPPLMILLILHWKHFFCNVWGWERAARCHSNSNYSHLQKRLVFLFFFWSILFVTTYAKHVCKQTSGPISSQLCCQLARRIRWWMTWWITWIIQHSLRKVTPCATARPLPFSSPW